MFGGPYSNFQALTAVRTVAERMELPPSQVICTGDIVAYCSQPEETARLCMDWSIHCIKGNCEEQLAADADNCGCGFNEGTSCSLLSVGWYSYARQNISDSTKRWMGDLPARLTFTLKERTFSVIHGGYQQTNRFIFPSTPVTEKASELADARADVMVAGHSGIPFIEETSQGVWFNAGVIGMPANEGENTCWYGMIKPSSDSLRLSLHRLDYSYQDAADHLAKEGFADPYAKALCTGIWPSHDVLPEKEREETGQPILEASLEIKL